MNGLIGIGLAAVALCMSVPAGSQLRVVETTSGSVWQHAGSGTSFPVAIGPLERTAVRDTGTKELDVIVGYKSPDEADELTFYLFKTQIVNASLWFDRALDAVMLRPGLVPGTARPEPQLFEPKPSRGVTGLRASLPITFGKYRASGIAMFPVGSWLLKIRLSSANSDLARLDALLTSAVTALDLPAPAGEPAAKPVVPCRDSISLKPVRFATRSKDDAGQILAASLVGAVPRQSQDYCRDRPGTAQLGVYRPRGAQDAYVAAISDAGRAIVVEPGIGSARNRPVYTFSALELGRSMIYRPLIALPEPAEALAYVLREQPVAISDFASGKVQTTILSDALK